MQEQQRTQVNQTDFVPDFLRCCTCGNVGGDRFTYDPNPKGLPPTETPILAVLIPKTAEPGTLQGPSVDAEPLFGTNGDDEEHGPESRRFVSIAELMGCARTGEPGAERCAQCGSYDVVGVAEAERDEVMLKACDADARRNVWDRDDLLFLAELRRRMGEDGSSGLADAGPTTGSTPSSELVRLYRLYRVCEERTQRTEAT